MFRQRNKTKGKSAALFLLVLCDRDEGTMKGLQARLPQRHHEMIIAVGFNQTSMYRVISSISRSFASDPYVHKIWALWNE